MTLPLPGEPVPSDVSVVTHADRFDGNPASSFGPTWDYDENTEGTYISYFDLMPAPSGVDPDYIVTGTDAGDLIDGTYVDPTDGDVVDGNDGNPLTPGVGDSDSIVAGAGNDTILSGVGDDTVDAGTGNDSVNGGAGNDLLLGGEGSDTIGVTDGFGNDTVVGGEDAGGTDVDVLDASAATTDLTVDLSAPETGTMTDGIDTIDFSEIEVVATGSGYDSITGSNGNDVILTGAGSDTVDSGGGNDSIDFGGPDGATDTLVLENGDGDDTLTGFEGPIDNGDGTYDPADQLNVTNLIDPNDNKPVTTTDTTITPDGNGNVTLTFPDGTSVTIEGAVPPTTDPTDPATESWLNAIGIPSEPDYIVTGTAGGDLIDNTYVDPTDGDVIDGGDGNPLTPGVGDSDSVMAGAGNDTILSGSGDDTVIAGSGDDVVDGGVGDDSIMGGEGSDTVDGGDGNDYINTRTSPGMGAPDLGLIYPDNPSTSGNETIQYSYTADTDPDNDRDSVVGGAGNDTILTGDDADTIDGGIGNDVIDAGFDADLVQGGAGADSIQGSEGADTIDGGDDNDVIYGGVSPLDPNYYIAQVYDLTDDIDPDPTNNADLLMGGAGNDRIYGQDDSDTLQGGTGDDTLDGGIDDDVLEGGVGADVLIGGEGDDEFIYTAGDGADTITDFGTGISGPIDDGDQTNNDFVDLSSFYNTSTLTSVNALIAGGGFATELGMLRADAEDGVIDGIIDGIDYSSIISGINLTIENGGSPVPGSALTFDTTNVMCFTAGTRIRTIDGLIAAESLRQGDLVWTKDDGYQPIRWIGHRTYNEKHLMDNPNIRPIVLRAGSLGVNIPERDLRVSPQHTMFVNSRALKNLFKVKEALIAAKHLVQIAGIDVDADVTSVTYILFLFDRHQIVEAEGAESESLFTGPVALDAVDEHAREEILDIFPELFNMNCDSLPQSVRPMLSGRQGRKLAQRDLNNGKSLAH